MGADIMTSFAEVAELLEKEKTLHKNAQEICHHITHEQGIYCLKRVLPFDMGRIIMHCSGPGRCTMDTIMVFTFLLGNQVDTEDYTPGFREFLYTDNMRSFNLHLELEK